MTWELRLSIIATLISVGTFLFSYFKWKQERKDRKEDIAQERKERLAARSDVIISVRLISEVSRGVPATWWRLEAQGGDLYSRTTVTGLWLWNGEGLAPIPPGNLRIDKPWMNLLTPLESIRIGVGQVHYINALDHERVPSNIHSLECLQVLVRWQTLGVVEHQLIYDIMIEPWH